MTIDIKHSVQVFAFVMIDPNTPSKTGTLGQALLPNASPKQNNHLYNWEGDRVHSAKYYIYGCKVIDLDR